jgi:hypothetical protein
MQQVEVPLDRELRPIAEQTLATLKLAADKAVAHHAAPAEFPLLPGREDLEHVMLARLRTRPEVKRRQAVERVMPRVRADARRRAEALGALARVDLRAPVPVAAQVDRIVRTLVLPTTSPLLRSSGAIALAAPVAQKAYTELEVRLRRAVCVDETREPFSDEIDLAGVALDATGDVRKIPRMTVFSDADSGDSRTFNPPHTFVRFPFAADATVTVNGKAKQVGWPRSYSVTFLLCEVDEGGFPEFVNTLYGKVKVLVAAKVAAAVAAHTGPLGPVLGPAVAAVVVWVMDKLWEHIIRIWEDDAFVPLTSTVTRPNPRVDFKGTPLGPVTGSRRMWFWKQHGGHYELHFDWHLAKPK